MSTEEWEVTNERTVEWNKEQSAYLRARLDGDICRRMTAESAARWHHAAKIIEVDGVEGYWTCREEYGEDIANVLIVAFMRRHLGSEKTYPPPDGIVNDVNNVLREKGLMK